MWFAGAPPAFMKLPPAYRITPPTPSPCARSDPTVPEMPLPSADQPAPFQRATRFAATPPALVKSPPAKSHGPCAANARTLALDTPPATPPPTADQCTPSQRAIPLAAFPPAVVKRPPA